MRVADFIEEYIAEGLVFTVLCRTDESIYFKGTKTEFERDHGRDVEGDDALGWLWLSYLDCWDRDGLIVYVEY